MKEIVSQYGRVFVAMMIAGLVFLAMGGIRSGMALARLYHGQTTSVAETNSFRLFRSKAGIDVSFLADDPIIAKEKVTICEHFEGKNRLGDAVELELIYVETEKGQTLGPQESLQGQWVMLETPGIYTFYFEGIDANGNRCEANMTVPVQGKLAGENS